MLSQVQQPPDFWERLLNYGTPLFILVLGGLVMVRYIFPRIMAYLEQQRLDQKAREEQQRLDSQRREEALLATLAARDHEARQQTLALQQQTQIMSQQGQQMEKLNRTQERHGSMADQQTQALTQMLEMIRQIREDQMRRNPSPPPPPPHGRRGQ